MLYVCSKAVTTLILISLLTAGCGRAPTRTTGEFEKYVQRFEEDSVKAGAPVKVTDILVERRVLGEGRMAMCSRSDTSDLDPPTVGVDGAIFASLTEVERQAVISHELGHCVLHREHRDEENEYGVPLSMMNSHSINMLLLESNAEYYNEELFKGPQVSPVKLETNHAEMVFPIVAK